MNIHDHIDLQYYAQEYIRYLGPVLCTGRFSLEHMVWRYAESGFKLTVEKMVKHEAKRIQKSPDAIRQNIKTYLQKAPFSFNDDTYFQRWLDLGWDGEKILSPSKGIQLVCQSFFVYLHKHHPKAHSRYIPLILPCVTYPLEVLEELEREAEEVWRLIAAGEQPVFDSVEALFDYLNADDENEV